MLNSICVGDSLIPSCFGFLEKYFTIRFTRRSYENKKLKLFYKLHWLTGEPLSVALVIMRQDYWHITHIATLEGYRDRGYARKLVNKITRNAKRKNAKYVSSNVRETNLVSRVFFEAMNFTLYDSLPTNLKKKPGFYFYAKQL